jgi:hypothetical protein
LWFWSRRRRRSRFLYQQSPDRVGRIRRR